MWYESKSEVCEYECSHDVVVGVASVVVGIDSCVASVVVGIYSCVATVIVWWVVDVTGFVLLVVVLWMNVIVVALKDDIGVVGKIK